jgi:hypothetical protein
VEPAIVIASPIAGMNRASRKHTKTSPKVTKALIFLVIPFSFQKSSSTVSLAGKTHSGAAVSTAKNNAKLPYIKQH